MLSVGRLCPINKCHLASCRGLAQGWQFNRLSWRDEGRYTHPHCPWSLPGLTEGHGAACLTSLSRLLLPLTETKRSPDWQTWWSLWWWWWRWWGGDASGSAGDGGFMRLQTDCDYVLGGSSESTQTTWLIRLSSVMNGYRHQCATGGHVTVVG